MKKKIILIVILISTILLSIHFIDRHNAEKKIDQYIQDYGISIDEISEEYYPLFNSLNSTPGFAKVIVTKDDKENSYIFDYDKEDDKVIFSANVYGNGGITFGDELMTELKHQPSDKVLP
ncbi:DUF3139 domain-containing protein [Terribacillus halophilus]|jgi:hypothetical protein|uniref:DUF3139 domain-containing protein n=1 Tax=Terribacillus halophilus TaxID=361279 RepID=UPI000985878F|nr:DUF3139 domain-containing protein [Terribacillus halophilus]